MNLSTFAFIITGVLLNAAAQLFLKAGTNALGGAIHLTAQNWFSTGIKVISQLPILAGLACYAISLVVWIIGLSRTEVSIAYPMLSLGYVVGTAGAWMFLGEVVSMQRMLALGVIVVGVALLART
jgi:multidrug transporter EmrE-like cation transporter